MSIIEAKCPNCGAPLTVDSTKDACYCEFCKTPFVTDKVINVTGDYISGDKIIHNEKHVNNGDMAFAIIFVVAVLFVAGIMLMLYSMR